MKIIKNFSEFLNEAAPAPEPVDNSSEKSSGFTFWFEEGQTKLPAAEETKMIDQISAAIASSIPTIQKFHNNSTHPLPKNFCELFAGTSHSGSFDTNKKVGDARLNYLQECFIKAMEKHGVRRDVSLKIITRSEREYRPSDLDVNFYDPSKLKPKGIERICYLIINPITTRGLSTSSIQAVGKQANLATKDPLGMEWNNIFVDSVDEAEIVKAIQRLQTHSDIVDLDAWMSSARSQSLAAFLSDKLVDDTTAKTQVVSHLNRCSQASGKGKCAQLSYGGDITITL